MPTKWKVYFRGSLKWFKTEKDADTHIKSILRGKSAAPKMNQREVDEMLYARELLKGVPIMTAVRFYLEHNPDEVRAKPLADAVAEFTLTFADLRPKTRIERTRNLRILKEHFPALTNVGAVSRHAVEQLLAEYESAHSHNALLKYMRQFFSWCCDHGYCAHNPTMKQGAKRDIQLRTTKSSKVILTLEDAAHVMKICRAEFPELVPAVAIQLYAGIRTEEIQRLNWSNVRDDSIFIPDNVAKMGHREGAARVIDWIPESLKPVLKNRPKSGPLAVAWKRRKTALIKRCGETKGDFVWGQNAFRHSYATYGCAFWQSADKMKLLMGQRDADTFFVSYRKYATHEQGCAFFGEDLSKK